MKKLLYLLLMITTITFIGCSDDDDNGGTDPVENSKPWVGTWLSTGTDVAPILVSVFNYDSVKVIMKDDKTIQLDTHVKDGAWSSISGVYTVTESESGDIHSIAINYTSFEQEGIIQVTEGNPDKMQLEAVQTVPDIGAVPRTVESGFGSDPALGIFNIQKYVRID